MERCPNCRARLKSPPVCYRCGADLSLPLRAERVAEQLERESIRRLLGGDLSGALAEIARLQTVKPSPLGKVLAGFCEQLDGSGSDLHRGGEPEIKDVESDYRHTFGE